MRVIVTGSHGAVAPYVIGELQSRGVDVVVFDRSKVEITSYDEVYNFIKKSNVQMFFHIATGPLEWLEYIQIACSQLNVKLIFTSSVSVFSEQGTGPYTVDSVPDATDDYGMYKRKGEEIVLKDPKNLILRLGWQIGYRRGSNNMLDFLIRQHEEKGYIEASDKWYPSCSFLLDTAKTIVDLSRNRQGIYLLNGNRKFTFYKIAKGLSHIFDMNWTIKEVNDIVRDDRMYDTRVKIKHINAIYK